MIPHRSSPGLRESSAGSAHSRPRPIPSFGLSGFPAVDPSRPKGAYDLEAGLLERGVEGSAIDDKGRGAMYGQEHRTLLGKKTDLQFRVRQNLSDEEKATLQRRVNNYAYGPQPDAPGRDGTNPSPSSGDEKKLAGADAAVARMQRLVVADNRGLAKKDAGKAMQQHQAAADVSKKSKIEIASLQSKETKAKKTAAKTSNEAGKKNSLAAKLDS